MSTAASFLLVLAIITQEGARADGNMVSWNLWTTTQMHCCFAVSLAPFISVLKMFNSYETGTGGCVGMVHKRADIVSGNNKGHMGVFLVEGGK